MIKPRKPWRTVEEVELATAEWVDWFNYRRLYEYCGDIALAELEAAHYAHHRAQPPLTAHTDKSPGTPGRFIALAQRDAVKSAPVGFGQHVAQQHVGTLSPRAGFDVLVPAGLGGRGLFERHELLDAQLLCCGQGGDRGRCR